MQPGTSLEEYVASGPVSGIVVVLGGRIAFERYPRMGPGDRHLLMSVTKVFASAIVGILEQRGLLDLGQPVDTVLFELAGSGWGGVTVGDVLGMASGSRLAGSGISSWLTGICSRAGSEAKGYTFRPVAIW